MVRAKFHCHSVLDNGPGKTIELAPVYSGSDENKQFFAATPGGSVHLYCVNPDAAAQFKPGTEFYVDFTPVPVPEPAPAPAS